jgi:hypothetical protein
MSAYRIRPDGTKTFTTIEHDDKWYWPSGTAIVLADGRSGVVEKAHSVSVDVRLTDGTLRKRVPVGGLARVSGSVHYNRTANGIAACDGYRRDVAISEPCAANIATVTCADCLELAEAEPCES